MAFVPPVFSNFGKGVADLIKKKFDPKSSQVVAKNTVSSELTIESTVNVGDKVSADVKTTYKNKDFGQLETEVKTAGDLGAELKLQKLYDGLTVTLKGNDSWTAKASAEFKREPAAVTAELERTNATVKGKAENFTRAGASAAVGFDGFSVGAGASYKIVAGAGAFDDYNFGSELALKDVTLTLKTEESANVLNFSYLYNVPTGRKFKTATGGQFKWNLKDNKKSFTLAAEHEVDEVNALKVKADTEGVVSAVLEHKLTNPNVKLAVAAGWDKSAGLLAAPAKPSTLAVSLTLGDA